MSPLVRSCVNTSYYQVWQTSKTIKTHGNCCYLFAWMQANLLVSDCYYQCAWWWIMVLKKATNNPLAQQVISIQNQKTIVFIKKTSLEKHGANILDLPNLCKLSFFNIDKLYFFGDKRQKKCLRNPMIGFFWKVLKQFFVLFIKKNEVKHIL